MKKIATYILSIVLLVAFTACDEEVTNPEFGNKDIPVIHVDWQYQMALNIGDIIKYKPQISPADGAVYEWLLNDKVIGTEKDLNYAIKEQGKYTLTFKVTRNGVENTRTADLIVVKPFVPKKYNKKVIGYITRNGNTADVQWDEITHLIISSALVTSAETPVDTNFTASKFDLKTLVSTAHNYGIYVLLDLTGKIDYMAGTGVWGDFGFYNTVVDANKRKKLIDDVLLFVKNNNIDGINIYLNNTSTGNFDNPAAVTEFFNAFVNAVPKKGSYGKFILTASLPGGWTTGILGMLAQIERFDWFHLMAFGAADTSPVHHASFGSCEGLANTWKGLGISNEKMVMAIPAVGVHYTFPDGVNIGWGNAWKYTAWKSYRDILTLDVNAETKNKINQDKGIFYDGHAEVLAKTKYVLDNNLAGVAIWVLENDSKDPAKSLSKKANDSLGN